MLILYRSLENNLVIKELREAIPLDAHLHDQVTFLTDNAKIIIIMNGDPRLLIES